MLLLPAFASAHQPRIIFSQTGDIQINNPEISQAFYDELKGSPRDYYINSDKDFALYLNLLVPTPANSTGKYSADVFLQKDGQADEKILTLDGSTFEWKDFYESFGRDYYLKGPEITQQVVAGRYKVEIYSADNLGKYVLAVGQKESFDVKSVLNIYWQLPLLKLAYFKTSVLEFIFTPFGIGAIAVVGALLILVALIYYIIGLIKASIKHNEAKTMLLTSGGMVPMKDEIIDLLQKPAYDVTVAFITTAYKHKLDENPDYVNIDLQVMKDMGFNVEEIDIEGKKEQQLMHLFESKDIIFVEGGNTFYLLRAMRGCHFEDVIRKLLKQGKVYIGVSAGSIVVGKTIKTAGWKDADKNAIGLRNLKGLGLVPFDIFVHYTPEWDETIRQEIPNQIKRSKDLRILTDGQALLVQGKEIDLIGEGEAIVV